MSIDDHDNSIQVPFTIYTLPIKCYSCGKTTNVLTYIKYGDNLSEDVLYPWNMKHLHTVQDIIFHMTHPDTEAYNIKILGTIKAYDDMLLKKYPQRIKNKFSKTLNKTYAMNLCEHCNSKQGWFYVYREIEKHILNQRPIEIEQSPDLLTLF